ncbi:unnamed protein product [Boreogadus saida]
MNSRSGGVSEKPTATGFNGRDGLRSARSSAVVVTPEQTATLLCVAAGLAAEHGDGRNRAPGKHVIQEREVLHLRNSASDITKIGQPATKPRGTPA